jgi:hypothetical protein
MLHIVALFCLPDGATRGVGLARDGDPEPIHFEETNTNFTIGWKGNYSVDGDAFVFIDNDSARIVTLLGYPTASLSWDNLKISNMFG